LLHQVGDLFELNVKLRCQKVNVTDQLSQPYKKKAKLQFCTLNLVIFIKQNGRENNVCRMLADVP
jgi:hypothetical protein